MAPTYTEETMPGQIHKPWFKVTMELTPGHQLVGEGISKMAAARNALSLALFQEVRECASSNRRGRTDWPKVHTGVAAIELGEPAQAIAIWIFE